MVTELGRGGARYERMISIGVIDEAESTCVEEKKDKNRSE